MGTLINVSLDVTKITKGKLKQGKKGQMYLDLTLSGDDRDLMFPFLNFKVFY